MSTNLSSTSALIRPNIAPGSTDLIFAATDLINFLRSKGLMVANDGGIPVKWQVGDGDNGSAEVFVESQGLPVAGNPTYSQASIAAAKYLRAVAKVTGHVRDQIARGGFVLNAADDALANAIKVLMDLMESTLAGTATDCSIGNAIDSTGTYAGLAAATVTEWASYESAVGGVLTRAALSGMHRDLIDAPRGANPDAILCDLNQVENYVNIVDAASSSFARTNPRAEFGQPYDLGVTKTARVSYQGIEFVPVRSITTTELYMVDIASGFRVLMQRDLEVKKLGETDDDDRSQISLGYVLQVKNRRKHGKLTGVTA